MKKTCAFLCIALGLMLGTARADSPKTYKVSLSEARIGTTDLDAGEYKVLIHRDEGKVEIMDLRSGELINVTGKLQVVDEKYDRTEVHSNNADSVKRITEIRIGGTKYKIDFRDAS